MIYAPASQVFPVAYLAWRLTAVADWLEWLARQSLRRATPPPAAPAPVEQVAPQPTVTGEALTGYLKRQVSDLSQERTETYTALHSFGFPPTGRGVAEDVRHALTTLTAQVAALTAQVAALTTAQHQAGEQTIDHSVAQTA